MTEPLRFLPFAFVADLEAPILSDEDHHHLARVRRVRDGDPLVIGDGVGGWRSATFGGTTPEPTGPIQRRPRPEPEVGIGFALTKGTKPELVVQKLTELGVDRIVPFVAERSVVRWDEVKAGVAHARFRKVAREAAMQSRQVWIPEVEPVTDLAAVAARPGAAYAEIGDDGLLPPSLDRPLVLIGPEGGWTPAEQAASPAPHVTLGGGCVLRAETAAIVAGSLLVALRNGLVRPA